VARHREGFSGTGHLLAVSRRWLAGKFQWGKRLLIGMIVVEG
jgi:hypothetical protein